MDDMLAAFPERMAVYDVFKMDARVGGGYGKRYDERKVRGYWSWRKQSKEGIEGDLRTLNYQATFWARRDFLTRVCKIAQGDYVDVGGKVYQVIDDQNFSREGGFCKCLMQVLAGPTDQQRTNTMVDRVVKRDY